MHWIIQENLFQENGQEILVTTLERMGISHQTVKVVPIAHELIPEVTETGSIITMGSILLSTIARERGWSPGAFFNDNFDYKVWYPILKDYLLNNDAVFTTVAEAIPPSSWENIFVRPVLDNKSFNGRVMTKEEFADWKIKMLNGDNYQISAETEIVYASPKNIGQEHRHFIVDGKVITSSRYKLNGRLNQIEGADDYIVKFAERMAAIFSPARMFVLDTYVTGDEVGVVELGCACNAGFYKTDVQKLVMALENLENL